MKLKRILVAVVGIFIFSCSPKVAVVSEVAKPLTPELAEAKLIYENNCAKCHKLYQPESRTAEQWQPILLKMQKKAKISDADREKIYSYVTML